MNEMMQCWYCSVTTILNLEKFKSSGDIIQEGIFCCIRDSLVQTISEVFVFESTILTCLENTVIMMRRLVFLPVAKKSTNENNM